MIKLPPNIATQFAEMVALTEKLPIGDAPDALKPALTELKEAARALNTAAHRFDRAALTLATLLGVTGDNPKGDA